MTEVRSLVRAVLDAFLVAQPYMNAVLGLAVVTYILHRLFCCSQHYNYPERIGMSLTAGGMLLATPALWMADTPFDGWSFNVARFGVALYIITGGLRRDRHHKRNMQQVAYWDGFREGRSAAARGAK